MGLWQVFIEQFLFLLYHPIYLFLIIVYALNCNILESICLTEINFQINIFFDNKGFTMNIKIERLSKDQINEMGINNWPIWTKEVSKFDWFYDSSEQCLILEGKIIVKHNEGELEINSGDFVTFPKGLKCVWNVIEPVRKHYNFE